MSEVPLYTPAPGCLSGVTGTSLARNGPCSGVASVGMHTFTAVVVLMKVSLSQGWREASGGEAGRQQTRSLGSQPLSRIATNVATMYALPRGPCEYVRKGTQGVGSALT